MICCDVVPGREAMKFKVRVLRLWSIASFMRPDEISSIEMVLIDEKVCYDCFDFFNCLTLFLILFTHV
jgi:hypothetical protein